MIGRVLAAFPLPVLEQPKFRSRNPSRAKHTHLAFSIDACYSSIDDIVLIDRKAGTFDIFELTVCFDREANFTAAHRLKDNRYAYYLKDMTALKPSVTSFEIGTRGFVSKDNYERLRNLHKFCRKGIKLSEFINNISALAINASYFIFICRKEGWEEPPFLNAPFNTT